MKHLLKTIAAASLLMSGAALAGEAQPANISGDSGNAGNSSLGLAVASFSASPAVRSSIAAAPGARVVTTNGQQVIVLDFTEGGVSYTLVVEQDGTATVYES